MVMLVMLILRRSRAWISVLGGSLRASCGISGVTNSNCGWLYIPANLDC